MAKVASNAIQKRYDHVPPSPIAGSGGIVDPTRFGQQHTHLGRPIVSPRTVNGGIVQSVPRKQGRIQPSPSSAKSDQRIFGWPGNRTGLFSQPGTVGDADLSTFGRIGPNPTNNFHNTSTIAQQGAIGVFGQGAVTHSNLVPEVQPHMRGNFFTHKPYKKNAIVRPQGGVNPNADLAVRPKPREVFNRPIRRPTFDASASLVNANAPSFSTFNTLRATFGQPDGMARWEKTKRGVVG